MESVAITQKSWSQSLPNARGAARVGGWAAPLAVPLALCLAPLPLPLTGLSAADCRSPLLSV